MTRSARRDDRSLRRWLLALFAGQVVLGAAAGAVIGAPDDPVDVVDLTAAGPSTTIDDATGLFVVREALAPAAEPVTPSTTAPAVSTTIDSSTSVPVTSGRQSTPTTSSIVSSAPAGGPTAPAPETHDHTSASIVTGPTTPSSQEQADALVVATRSKMDRWRDPAAARAAGYTSLTPPGLALPAGFIDHWIHLGHTSTPETLNPEAIESIVYVADGQGGLSLIGAMYMLPFGTTEADIPAYGSGVIFWHRHTDHCFMQIEGELRYVGPTGPDGQCPPGAILVPTPPMVHVWDIPNICGPFATDAYPTGPEACGNTISA